MGAGATKSAKINERALQLGSTPLLVNMKEESVQVLASLCQEQDLAAGEMVPDNCFAVILEGTISVSVVVPKKTKKGDKSKGKKVNVEETLSLKEAGHYLCKRSQETMGDEATKKAVSKLGMTTMKAITAAKLLYLTEENVQKFIEQCPVDAPLFVGILKTDIIELLRSIPFFGMYETIDGLSPRSSDRASLRALSDLTHYESAAEGQVIFNQGDTDAEKFYVIVQGKVSVSADKAGEESQMQVASIESGGHFGEMALMTTMPRSATIKAEERCLFLTLQKSDLTQFFELMTGIHTQMLQHAKQRMLATLKAFDVPLFANTPDAEVPELASLCDIEQLKKDEYCWKEGDVTDRFCIVVYGKIQIRSEQPGHEWNTNPQELGPGKYFGDTAICLKSLRVAGAKCHSDSCVLLSISSPKFHHFFTRFPELLSEFELRIFHEKITLRQILDNPTARSSYREYLDTEHATENLLFWQDAEAFRRIDPNSGSGDRNKYGGGGPIAAISEEQETVDLDEEVAAVENAGGEGKEEPASPKTAADDVIGSLLLGEDQEFADASGPGPDNYWSTEIDEAVTAASFMVTGSGAAGAAGVGAADGDDKAEDTTKKSHRKSLVQDFKAAMEAQKASSTASGALGEKLKSIKLSQMAVLANAIYFKYVDKNADLMVNIRGDKTKKIKDAIDAATPTADMFLEAQEEIYKLMEKDNFPRYKSSKFFKTLGEKVGFYDKDALGAETASKVGDARYVKKERRWTFRKD